MGLGRRVKKVVREVLAEEHFRNRYWDEKKKLRSAEKYVGRRAAQDLAYDQARREKAYGREYEGMGNRPKSTYKGSSKPMKGTEYVRPVRKKR